MYVQEQQDYKIDFPRDLFNYKYIPLLHCVKPYMILMWSWASGKSAFVAQNELVKSYVKWNRCLCIRKVKDTLKESCFEELSTWISEWNLEEDFEITKSPMKITNKKTWSDFIFRWMDKPEKIKSVSWVTRVWCEEASELTRKDFDQLDIRLRSKWQLQITCTYNPVDKEHFLNADFYLIWNTDEVEVMHTTFLDNRFVSDKYKTKMERLKRTNPTYYKIYALWEFAKLDGLVYPEYKVVASIPPEAEYICHGLDWWYRDPTAIVWIYKYKDWYLYDEEYYQSEIITREIVNELKDMDAWDVYADSAEPDRIEEAYDAWINIYPAKKGPWSIIAWIDKVSEDTIYITSTSSNMIREINVYSWKVDKNWNAVKDKEWRPIPQYWWAHTLDAARYGKNWGIVEDWFHTILVKKK